LSSSHVFLIAGLLVVLLVSALAVVGSKYQSRSLFVAIQTQKVSLDEYEIEWGRLQLELTTLTEENRVERVAKKQLKLKMPDREKTIYIKP
jgi:cell division protein FtsL